MWATPRVLTRFSCTRLFFLDHIQQRVWHAQVFYLSPEQKWSVRTVSPYRVKGKCQTHRATADVALFDFPKAVALCARLVYLAERDVHKIVAVYEVSIERLSVLELDQLRSAIVNN